MEEQEPSAKIDNPETVFPSPDSPPTAEYHEAGSASGPYPEAAAKRLALTQRLAEAFREGLASARPDGAVRPDAVIPPRVKKKQQESSDTQILDRIIQGGGSAAAGIGDMASSALDTFVQMVKKTPALTQKYAEAFREGAASVKPRASREGSEEGWTAAREKESPPGGRAIRDRVFQAGGSAAGFVREAVSAVMPGEVSGIRQKIRLARKKINTLTIDIGAEVVNSWSSGVVETERLSALLDELRKNEAEVLIMQARLAEVAAAARSAQTVKHESAVTHPAADQEDSRLDAGDSEAKLNEPVEHMDDVGVDHPLFDDPGEGAVSQPENSDAVATDPDAADLSVAVEPDSEAPESHFAPEGQVDEEPLAPEEQVDEEPRRRKKRTERPSR